MAKSYFLKIKSPRNWSVKDAFVKLEERSPQATHRTLLKELKKELRHARDSGTNAQSEAAQRLLDRWNDIKAELTCPNKEVDVDTQQGVVATASNSSQSLVVCYGDCNVAGDLNVQSISTPRPSANTKNRESSSSESEPTSWSSCNPHPRRRSISIYSSASYTLNNAIGPAECVVEGIDFAEECQLYRKRSIHGAQERESLSDGRVLSLSFIFLVSTTERCMLSSLPNKTAVIRAFPTNEMLQRVSNGLLFDCKIIGDLIDDASEDDAIRRQLLTMSADAEDIGDEAHLAGLAVLRNVVERLNHWRPTNSLREDSLIKQALLSIVDATVGKVQDTECEWGTYSMVPHHRSESRELFLPDFALYNSQVSSEVRFEFMTMEVKAPKPSSNKHESDLVRLGKQLQMMIDKQLLFGVIHPVAVGVLVRGVEVKFYKMKLDGNGLYVFIELTTLHLMRSPSDTLSIPRLIERFLQLKAIVQAGIRDLYSAAKRSRHGGKNSCEIDSRKKNMVRACSVPIVQCKPDAPKKRKCRN